MRKTTKFLIVFTLLSVIGFNASAQYCTFTVDYTNSFEAGITSVTLNSTPAINRTSTTIENNGFTNTGLTVAVYKGQTYSLGVTRNQDIMVCGLYNVVVYIDYNGDLDFDDVGENVATWTEIAAGVGTQNITIPVTAITGQVRMRVALKMSTTCGHSGVSPCNNPPDPIAWHGEVEDYTLNIQSPTGLNELNMASQISVSPNPMTNTATFNLLKHVDNGQVVVYDLLGKEVKRLSFSGKTATINNYNLTGGLYIYKIISKNDIIGTGKLMVR